MSLNVGQLIAERDELEATIKDVPKIRARITLLNKLIALEDPLGAFTQNAGRTRAIGENTCPDCDVPGFSTPHGLTMHRTKMHGYKKPVKRTRKAA